MSKDEFILKINKSKVDFTHIKGGIKREEIKDEKMRSIFDSVDTDDNHELSDNEIGLFFGLVKEQAQKHNRKNLGKREYKKLLKQLDKHDIKLENVDRATFLDFLSNLKQASDKPAQVQEQPAVQEEVSQGVVEEEEKEQPAEQDEVLQEVMEEEKEEPAKAVEDKPRVQNNTRPKAVKSKNGNSQKPTGVRGSKQKSVVPSEVKVTVPKAEVGARTKQIEKYRAQGKNLTASLKQNDTKGLSVQNIAYAFTSEVKFQEMTENTKHFVFRYLVQRLRDLGIFQAGKDYGVYNSFKKMSPNEQNKVLREYRNRIVVHENKVWRADVDRVNKANAERPKQQKVFDDANKLLNDAANGKIKPKKIDNGYYDDGTSEKIAEFKDGKKINVYYDENGKIIDLRIYFSDPGDSDVSYTAKDAHVDTDHSNGSFERTIKSGYDFEKIKAAAEKIFGKFEPQKAEEEPETEETQTAEEEAPADEVSQEADTTPATQAEQKFTTAQIKTTVTYRKYSPTQIKQFMQEGASIAAGQNGIETMNTHNVAYSIVHGDKYAGTKNAQKIFTSLVQRMRKLGIFEYGKDYGSYATLSKLPAAKQDEIIHAYALRIRKKDNEHLNAAQEAAKQQKVFDEANKFLVDMANDKTHLSATIAWANDKHNLLSANLDDGRGIRVAVNEKGEIILIDIRYSNDDQFDVEYSSVYAQADTDLNNDVWEITLRSGFKFNELKKVAEAIFADFLNKEKSE